MITSRELEDIKNERKDVPVLGMDELISLSSLGRLTGPKPYGFQDFVMPDGVQELVDDNVRGEETLSIAEAVANTYDRRINRVDGLTAVDLGKNIADSISAVVGKVRIEAPGLHLGKVYIQGVARLVRDMETSRAVHYLDDEFVGELQDIVPEDAPMWNSIGNYFSVGELLRRAYIEQNPDIATIASVRKAWEIAKDKTEYCSALTDGRVHKDFADSLTDRAILELTTRMPKSVDKRLKKTMELFEEFAPNHQLVFTYGASHATNELLRRVESVSSDEIEKIFAGYERVSAALVREGIQPTAAVYLAIRKLQGSTENLQKLLDSKGLDRLLRDFGTDGDIDARKRAAKERGNITPELAGISKHGVEYRDRIFDIDESNVFARAEKKKLYSMLSEAHRNYAEYAYGIEPIVGEKFSDIERRQFSLALTKSVYALRYLIDHGTKPEIVPMGSKNVEVSMTKEQMLQALSYIHEFTRYQRLIKFDTDAPDVDDVSVEEPNLEIGYVQDTSSRMLLLTKLYPAPVAGNFERGKSPRMNRACGLGGDMPSLVAEEREANSLSVRNDLDRDGVLRLDIGGKTEDPSTPDFLVAKLLSLGGWYRAKLLGYEPTDYHVEIDTMTNEEFAKIVRRYRRSVRYAGQTLRVSAVAAEAAQLAQAAPEIRELHQHEQVRKFAA